MVRALLWFIGAFLFVSSYASVSCGSCDLVLQPSPNWGEKDGKCLPACLSQDGGFVSSVSCESAGYTSLSSYDTTYCCKGTSTTATSCTSSSMQSSMTSVLQCLFFPSTCSQTNLTATNCSATSQTVASVATTSLPTLTTEQIFMCYFLPFACLMIQNTSFGSTSTIPSTTVTVEATPTPTATSSGSSSTSTSSTTDCKSLATGRTMVALTFGQSNAANSVPTGVDAGDHVYNFYEGQCYKAVDPMKGASTSTTTNGSVWSRLGKKLIASGKYDNVIFVTIAVGGSSITSWIPGGVNHTALDNAIAQMQSAGLEYTHLLWHQGETDGAMNMSGETYKSYFNSMYSDIRSHGVTAPIYVCIATYIMGQISTEIETAQSALINNSTILAGPNTDNLGMMYRQGDNTHFSDTGADQFADLWLQIL